MPTMQTKILTFFAENPNRTTKENIYILILGKHPETKITTFIKELYNLMQEGVISRDPEGLYGLGVVRTKRMDDWLPVTHEPLKEDKIIGETDG